MAPFVWGGAEELAHHLVSNLNRLGHDARLFRIPFAWEPFSRIPVEMARLKALRLPSADRVITMKFPIYLLNADHHVTWLIHQYRQAYDLWDTPYCNIPHTREGMAIRDQIIEHDNDALGTRERLFTISGEISARLEKNNHISAPPLRAPLNDPELFVGGEYGDYILAPGRINASKRQVLALEAAARAGPDVRLVIAGPPETAEDAKRLRETVEKHGLQERVKLDLRFLTRRELADYVNHCRAVVYLPFQEDSYGYVTMEAFEARKPVITVKDAGELLEIVIDGETGQVVGPEEEQLAAAMRRYFADPGLARDHGTAGHALWRSKGVNWQENIASLLG